MTEKRYLNIIPSGIQDIETGKIICGSKIGDLLNKQDGMIQRLNQEILSCHDTLVTIEALCDAVLNYDFENVTDKVDFCHMLNEMDNKDLMFLKECFESIRDNNLKKMTSLTVECMGDVK